MSVIAVSGASGFVGRHFCREAVQQGHRIVPIVRPATADALEPARLRNAIAGADAVVHLAARAHVLRESAGDALTEFRAANVELTQRIALAAIDAGIPRFVFVSSAGVLGRSSPAAGFDEHSRPDPHDDYTRTKAEAEQWLSTEAGQRCELVVVRPPLVYGPDARGNFGRLLHAVVGRRALPLGSLDAPRSVVGVRNLSDFLLLCVTHPRAAGLPLLIADAETTTIKALAQQIAALAGVPSRTFVLPASMLGLALRAIGRRADADRLTCPFVVRPRRGEMELGWKPRFTQSAELSWTVESFLRERR
jgi:UDP-glucose 4-epimerase